MTDREVMQQALEALESGLAFPTHSDILQNLRTALAMHQVSDFVQAQEQQAEPVAMRMPKVGDRVICLEDESFGEVVSLTGGGSPDITFDDGTRGTYMLREFAELFGYAEQRQQQAEPPPEWLLIKNILDEYGLDAIAFVAAWKAAQRPWVGLTDEEANLIWENTDDKDSWELIKRVEAKLKERNI